MRQVWNPLQVKAGSLEDAKQKAMVIDRSCNTKDVTAYPDKVTYKQLTWEDGYDHEYQQD